MIGGKGVWAVKVKKVMSYCVAGGGLSQPKSNKKTDRGKGRQLLSKPVNQSQSDVISGRPFDFELLRFLTRPAKYANRTICFAQVVLLSVS